MNDYYVKRTGEDADLDDFCGVEQHEDEVEKFPTTITRLTEALERIAGEPCERLKLNPNAPTCRSPVPGEGTAPDYWCVGCIARTALENPTSPKEAG